MTSRRIVYFVRWCLLGVIWLFVGGLCLGRSVYLPTGTAERVQAFTRPYEFSYEGWLARAVALKLRYAALGTHRYLDQAAQKQVVLDYLDLVRAIQVDEDALQRLHGDPNLSEEARAARLEEVQARLQAAYARRETLAPLAEAVLQAQVATVVREMGLGDPPFGTPFPPVLFHISPIPYGLVVSPREVIRQDALISLDPDLPLERQIALEEQVAQALNVSTLVVPIGGIGVYPTMVMQTTDLNWLVEVVAHEWTHNWLDQRPLGLHYGDSPELRTMNETTASIAGKEIGREVIARFYPEHLPPPPPPPSARSTTPEPAPPAFDFRAEMHRTRVTVDRLLAEGKVEEAEAYMEQRRLVFWEHGYHIRKLNQAYFAFYGAYADEPGGAAGEDPVGEAVRQLRAQSPTLAAFLRRIARMSSFAQLQAAVQAAP